MTGGPMDSRQVWLRLGAALLAVAAAAGAWLLVIQLLRDTL
jgi:hypothetical protein